MAESAERESWSVRHICEISAMPGMKIRIAPACSARVCFALRAAVVAGERCASVGELRPGNKVAGVPRPDAEVG